MRILHESENLAHELSNNCNIHLISKCNEEIDSRYYVLDFDLANRKVFNFIDLNLYVSNNPIEKHNFIQYSVICPYRIIQVRFLLYI